MLISIEYTDSDGREEKERGRAETERGVTEFKIGIKALRQ